MSNQEATIFVIEDDDVDLLSIKRVLAKLKISNPIRHAKDGVEAMDILKGANGYSPISRPYIIFLDLNMPRMNGLQFLEAARADETLNDATVFVLTTSETDDDILGAYKLNVAGYIVKSDLEESLREAFLQLDYAWTLLAPA